MNNEKIVISGTNIHKSYDNFKAVKGIDFNVEKATCFGFLGPNGAGKTTLMKLIYGRINRDINNSGKLNVFGYDPAENPCEIKAITGVAPQDNNLDADLNVMENLTTYSKFFGLKKHTVTKKINELLDFMQLTEKANKKCIALSGGMVRRLLIARSLINNPKLIILDEPTVGLDPQVRQIIWQKIRQLKKEGITILLTTHYMDEAYQICDKIIIMDKGEKIIEGQPKSLLKKNIDRFVLELPPLSKNILEGYLKDSENVSFEYEPDQPVYCYSESFKSLQNVANKLSNDDYVLRNSNLEDLFIKLTGRSLNENQ
ncbi:MAG: ABC transporter ATP-binding protein [bacterium]|nr:ABC transporter ATP-binding protein [bacterium]